MAARKPLTLVSGELRELPAGDSVTGLVALNYVGTARYERWRVPARAYGNHAAVSLNGSILYAFRERMDASHTIDRIGLQVATAAAGGSLARVGIYDCPDEDGDPYPGALLVDSGSFAIDTTGQKIATVSLAVQAGRTYWFAYAANVGATVRGLAVTQLDPWLGFDSTWATAASYIGATFTYAALPATYPASAPLGTTAIPAVFYRLA